MPDLQYRQKRIREKKGQSTQRDVLKEVASWSLLVFRKVNNMISRYPESNRISNIVNGQQFDQVMENGTQYGLNYDHSTCFFDNYIRLTQKAPVPNMWAFAPNENADYADTVGGSRNIYMSSMITFGCENVLYSFSVKDNGKNILSSVMTWDNCENIYMSKGITRSFNIFYSRFISNCSNIWFSTNMIGCHECLFCSGLNNKSYCINNNQLSKKEYKIQKQKILQQKKSFLKWYNTLEMIGNNFGSKKCNGSFVVNSMDVYNGHCVYSLKGGRNLFFVGSDFDNKDMMDGVNCSFFSNCAGTMSLTRCEHIYNSVHIGDSSNIYRSNFLVGCKYCLGCIGLKNKQFCILNKQYSKEERYEKVNKIFQKMEENGVFGNFFPGSINPFYFNDTIAYLVDDSFTKEEVEAEGYLRRDEPIKVDIPEGVQTVSVYDLDKFEGWKDKAGNIIHHPDKSQNLKSSDSLSGDPETSSGGHRWIDPEILRKVIVDEAGNAYRVIPMEYDFLMKYGLPLPRRHRLERLRGHFRMK